MPQHERRACKTSLLPAIASASASEQRFRIAAGTACAAEVCLTRHQQVGAQFVRFAVWKRVLLFARAKLVSARRLAGELNLQRSNATSNLLAARRLVHTLYFAYLYPSHSLSRSCISRIQWKP